MLSKFEAVHRPRSPQVVADQIIALVRSGDLVGGDQLPPERDIAEALGVSRPSVREAIHALATSGVVTVKHGRGTFVNAAPATGVLRTPLDTMLLLRQISVVNLVEARSIVEGQAAALAAERMSDEEKESLVQQLELIKGVEDPERFLRLDHEFHLTIAGGTRNPVLHLMLDGVRGVLLDARLRSAKKIDALLATYSEHSRVVEAIVRSDGPGACEAMLDHLERTKQRVDAQFNTAGGAIGRKK